jgi:hypothetical protein
VDDARTLVFACHGVTLAVEAAPELAGPLAEAALQPGSRVLDEAEAARANAERTYRAHAHAGGRVALLADDAPLAEAELDEALAILDADVRLFVASRSPESVFVHAGVVGVRGRAIVIPGRTFTGKSTLVAALVAAGAEYCSDEYAVLDAAGRVHPFARRLSLRDPGRRRGRRVDPGELGATVGEAPLEPGLVVVTWFQANARFEPAPISAGQAALALFDNAVAARLAPERVWPAIAAAAQRARAFRSPRGEAVSTAGPLLALLDP